MDTSAASSLSRGELQGAFCLLLLSKTPDPHLKLELQRLAQERKIWLPQAPAEAASLLFAGVAPTPALVERW